MQSIASDGHGFQFWRGHSEDINTAAAPFCDLVRRVIRDPMVLKFLKFALSLNGGESAGDFQQKFNDHIGGSKLESVASKLACRIKDCGKLAKWQIIDGMCNLASSLKGCDLMCVSEGENAKNGLGRPVVIDLLRKNAMCTQGNPLYQCKNVEDSDSCKNQVRAFGHQVVAAAPL